MLQQSQTRAHRLGLLALPLALAMATAPAEGGRKAYLEKRAAVERASAARRAKPTPTRRSVPAASPRAAPTRASRVTAPVRTTQRAPVSRPAATPTVRRGPAIRTITRVAPTRATSPRPAAPSVQTAPRPTVRTVKASPAPAATTHAARAARFVREPRSVPTVEQSGRIIRPLPSATAPTRTRVAAQPSTIVSAAKPSPSVAAARSGAHRTTQLASARSRHGHGSHHGYSSHRSHSSKSRYSFGIHLGSGHYGYGTHYRYGYSHYPYSHYPYSYRHYYSPIYRYSSSYCYPYSSYSYGHSYYPSTTCVITYFSGTTIKYCKTHRTYPYTGCSLVRYAPAYTYPQVVGNQAELVVPPATPNDYPAHADGWKLLELDRPHDALTAFATETRQHLGIGLPHVGYALTQAMLADDAQAIAAMRKAVEIQPESLGQVPVDEGLTRQIKTLLLHFHQVAAGQEQKPGAWFMLGALDHILGNDVRANAAIQKALQQGDRSNSALRLAARIEHGLSRQFKYDYQD